MVSTILPALKLSKFKLHRSQLWYKINRAFNPKDSWRIRPRSLAARTQSPDIVHYYNTIVLAKPQTKYNTFNFLNKYVTAALFNPLVFKRSTTSLNNQYLQTNNRISVWFRLIRKTVGFFTTLKLKYKGKSFRWHRKAKSILLRFGRSHLVVVKPKPAVFWRKHGRQKIIFWGSNRWYLWRFLKKAVSWRPMNIYHGRGLRLTKQKVWRKSGKVSAYR